MWQIYDIQLKLMQHNNKQHKSTLFLEASVVLLNCFALYQELSQYFTFITKDLTKHIVHLFTYSTIISILGWQ